MAYRSSSAAVGAAGTAPSTTVPAGVVAGDIVVLAYGVDGTTETPSWPAGFTQLDLKTNTTPDGQQSAIAWKRLTGADSGSYTFGATFADAWVLHALAFSGRDGAASPSVSAVSTSTVGNTSPVTVTTNSLAASSADDLLWVLAPDLTAAAYLGATAPSGFTKRQESTANFDVLTTATEDNVVSGATGSLSTTFTLSSGTAGWIAWVVDLPAPLAVANPGTPFIPHRMPIV